MTEYVLCIMLVLNALTLLFEVKLSSDWMSRIEKKIDGMKAYTDAMCYVLRNAKVHNTDVIAKDGMTAQELMDNAKKILDDDQESEEQG